MKARIKITALLLTVALLLSTALPAGASEPQFISGTFVNDFGHYYEMIPSADAIDATIVKGSYKDLVFFKQVMPLWGPTDFYVVMIYRGGIETIMQQAKQGKDPEVVEYFYKNADEVEKDGNMTIRINADSRYPVGDYAMSCFPMDGRTGKVYYRMDPFWTELHVVSAPRQAQDFSMYVIMDDGLHEFIDNDVIEVDYPTTYMLFAPEPIPCTDRLTYSLSCTMSGFVTFGTYHNYIVLSPNSNYHALTRINVESGKLRHSFWMSTLDGDERTMLQLTHEKTVLCVGGEDACTVKEKPGQTRVYVSPDWTSSDPSVATVTSWGLVKALKPGKVKITAVAGRFKQSVEYTVQYHQLPEDAPVSTRTATQPRQAVGHCSVCGRDDAINVFEPAIFTDTVWNSWYSKHVDKVYDAGLMKGTGEHTFAPNAPVNRAMAATVLYRIAGEPEVEGACPFKDVPAKKYYTNAVIWASQKGIVEGYPDGTFRPNDNITREQLAAILFRYAKADGIIQDTDADLSGFPDAVNVHKYARQAMGWAVGEGLINGVGSGGKSWLQPANNATRAQFATIISRYMSTVDPLTPAMPDPENPIPTPTDPDMPVPVDQDP